MEFYGHRFRRIVPSLALVLVFTAIVGRYLLWADEFKSLGKHIFHSAFFSENILLNREVNYFDISADFKPLLHFWSLGIEEQFYLVWPVLLVLCVGKKKIFSPVLVFGLGVISLVYKLYEIDQTRSDLFYLLPARFWELTAGGVLAYAQIRRAKSSVQSFSSHVLSAFAFTMLLGWAFLPVTGMAPARWHMILSVLIPVLTTFGLIFAGEDAWVNRKILSQKPMLFIGKISYPLYLWHWVILSFIRIHFHHISEAPPPTMTILAGVASAFILAWISYHYVEIPVQRRLFSDKLPAKKNLSYVVSGLTVIALIGLTGFAFKNGKLLTASQARQEKLLDAYDRFKHDVHARDSAYRNECNFYSTKIIDKTCYTPQRPRKVFIWGDSHAQQLNHGLLTHLPSDTSLLQVASSLCPASIHFDNSLEYCNHGNQFALEKIGEVKPDVVILAKEQGHESMDWEELARHLRSLGVKKVIVLGPVPQWHPTLYQIIAHSYLDNVPTYLEDGIRKDIFLTDEKMKTKFSNNEYFVYISLLDSLCHAHACKTLAGPDIMTDLITTDSGHLSLAGSEYIAKNIIIPVLKRFLR